MSTGLSAPVAQPNSLTSFLNDLNELAALKQQETQLATQIASSNPRDVLGTDTITFPNGMKRPATDAELMAAAKTFADMPTPKMEGFEAVSDILGNVPFVRDVVNTPVSMTAYVAARRIQNGPDDPLVKLTSPGMTKGAAFAAIETARRQIERTEGGVQRFYESLGLPQMAAQMVGGVHQQVMGNAEFLPVVLSSGVVSKGLAAGARKAGKTAVADLLEMEAKEAFKQGAGTLAKQQAAQTGAAAVNAVVNPLAASREVIQRITPRGMEQTPTGEILPTDGESLGTAIPKAIVSQTIEMQSEGLGEIMGPALGAALKRSGLSAKAVAAVPEFVKRWAKTSAGKTARDLATDMKTNIPGFHGTPLQILEERINEVAQFSAGTQEDAGVTGQVMQGDIGGAAKQLGQEVLAFGVMGGVNRGVGRLNRAEGQPADPQAIANWIGVNPDGAMAVRRLPDNPSRQQWSAAVKAAPELADMDIRSAQDRAEFMRSFRQADDIDEQGRMDDVFEQNAEPSRQLIREQAVERSQTPPTMVAQPPVAGGKNMGLRKGVATPRQIISEQEVVPPAWPEQVQQTQQQEPVNAAQQVQGQPQGRPEGQVAEPPQQQPQQPVAEQQPAVSPQSAHELDLSDLEPGEQEKVRDRLSKGASLAKAKEDVKHMRASSAPWAIDVMDKLIGQGMPREMAMDFAQKAQAGVQQWGTDWKQKLDALEAEYVAKIPQGKSPTFEVAVRNAAQKSIMRLEEAGVSDDAMKEFSSRVSQIVAESEQDAKDKVATLESEYVPQPDRPKIGQAGVTKAVAEPPSSAKEPWQMTRDEVSQEATTRIEQAYETGGASRAIDDVSQALADHRRDVSDAIASGKPVPPEVLAEYPDLQPKSKGIKPDATPAVEPPKKVGLRGQTAIPGTEESVAESEQKQQARKDDAQSKSQFTSKGGQQQSFITGIGRDLPGQNTLFDVDPLPGAMSKDAAAQRQSEEAGQSGAATIDGYQVQQIPVESVKIDPKRFQFKGNVNEEGVVTENALQGDWDPMAGGVFTLWRDNAGQLYVVNGHHRFDLARRRGVQTIPAFVLNEADGITESKARAIGAEVNIKEGQGTEHDYAQFFHETEISEDAARERGLLARRKGQAGFVVGKFAIDDVYYGFRNGKVGLEAAFDIADIARDRKDVQAVAIRRAKTADNPKGLSGEDLRQFLYIAVNTKPASSRSSGPEQLILFGGENQAALDEMDRMAKAARQIIDAKKEYLLAGSGFLRRPETAGELGISADEQRLADEYQQRREDFDRWDKGKWQTDPELVKQVRVAAGLEGDTQEAPKEKNKGVKRGPKKPSKGAKGAVDTTGDKPSVLGRKLDRPGVMRQEDDASDKPQPGTELQRRENPAVPPKEAPPRPVDIIESARELFGGAIEPGRMWSKNAAGEFEVRTEAIHLAKGHEGNIVVAGHETAHRIDKQQKIVEGDVPSEVRRALVRVDYAPTTHAIAIMNGADKYLSQREGFAEYVRHRLQGTTQPTASKKLVDEGTITQEYADALQVIERWFENTWLPAHPDIAKKLATLTDGVARYIAAGPQHRILAGTKGVEGVRPTLVSMREYPEVGWKHLDDAIGRFRRDWVNQWEFLERYEAEVVKKGGALPEDNLSALGFARSLDNASSLAASFVHDGVRTWDGKTVLHDGLTAAIRRNGFKTQAEIDEWEAYHIARRVTEIHKNKPEYRSSADIRDMEDMLEKIKRDPGKKDRYEAMTKDYTAFNNAVLDWAVDMGLVTAEDAHKMKDSHGGVYMYMAREQRRRGKPSSFTPNVGMGVIPLHNPFKRLKQGSQMPFYRPVEAALLKTYETISNAFQKQVVVQMWKSQRKAQGMGAWIEDVPAGQKATRVKLDDMLAQLVDAGVVEKKDADLMRAVAKVKRGEPNDRAERVIKDQLGVDSADFDDFKKYQEAVEEVATKAGIANIDKTLLAFTPNYAMSQKEGVFSFKDDTGQMRTVRVHPEVFNALIMSRSFGTQNAFGKLINVFGGLISRGAVRYNVAFPLANLVRDYWTQVAQANEQSLPSTLAQPLNGVLQMTMDALKQHGIVAGERDIMTELFVEKGSAQWYAMNTSPIGLHELKRKVLTDAGVSQPLVVKDAVRGGLKGLTDVLTLGEAAVRRGEFVASLQNQGYYSIGNKWHELGDDGTFVPLPDDAQPPEYAIAKAALAARDVTVDFQTRGALAKQLPMFFGPFFNAKVQSLDRMYRQIKTALAHPEKKVRDKAVKRLAAFAAMQSALAALLWYFTHDEDWYNADRESWLKYRYFQINDWLRIPKGYEWSIFANVTEAMLNVMFKKDPENTKKTVERFLTDRSELGEFSYATAESIAPLSLPPKVPIVEDMPLVSTIYQLATNQDWRGKPIVTKDIADLETTEQYRDTTPQAYRAAGRAFGVSPVQVEYATDAVTGGMSRRAVRTIDKLAEGDVGGAVTSSVASGFTIPRDSSRATQDYFDALERADKRVQTAARRKQPDIEAKDALDMLTAYGDVLKAIRKESREAASEADKTALWHMEIGTARDAIGKSPLARYKSAMSPDAQLPPKIKEARDQELLKQMRKIAANKPVSVTELERKSGMTLAEKQAEWARDKKVAAEILRGAGWSWNTLAPVWRDGTPRTETDGTKQSRIRVQVDLGSQ